MQVYQSAARVANVLVGLGLEVGDRLAVQVEKSEFALALYAACMQSGIVYLPLNTAHSAGHFVQNSGASCLSRRVKSGRFDAARQAWHHINNT